MDEMIKQIKKDLVDAYNDLRINSEMAMQAIIFQSLEKFINSKKVSKGIRIFVEPSMLGFKPDTVIVNIKTKKYLRCLNTNACRTTGLAKANWKTT
ncbi:hypothetical protein [Chitinilyticum aquatile]|uniref:hypothetical protein n=1 Tax=Chitinilyticum aquatile TaxID=362520 RepID=UPI00048D7EA2|nr:hypothetical protein [Chitinilyticum aquatile]